MAPNAVEEAVQSNRPPSSSSGVFTPSQADEQWTPNTVQPEQNSPSPLPFFHLLERLKTTKREGWRRFGIDHGESIADHMYRMSIITLLCPASLSSTLDIPRCTKMALIHDMAESLVGDITPVDGVTKGEKSRRESETMEYICQGLLGGVGGGEAGRGMREVWREYEDGETRESMFVHDVDKIELLLQMLEYERSHHGRIELGEFSHVAKRIAMPEVQAWAAELLAEREGFWATLGGKPKGVGEVSEERRRLQEAYYAGHGHGEVNGANGTAS
ncbi:uncharacterized protein LTR77_007774 [Saxophila tyrrhenica]|uniref:5'-deoxynucleotidase n=1 Tax=Saxophila tyrrhenica TaxID=1690608 RepID=A0AAV9P6U6_9PEZI|nr:hypothetical protein LTR77_007774 [Saxophila tyrrhenica]